MAKLYFRYGAMNSGKSTILLQVAHNYEERGMVVKLIKPKIDSKGDGKIVSRLGISRDTDFLVEKNYDIRDLDLKGVNCLLVDEVQFLSAEQIDQLFEIAVMKDIPVICYGLRIDFMGKGFEGSTRLLEIAHTIEEMKTICRCGKKATMNIRKIDGVPIFSGAQVEIDDGSKVEYEAVCGKCYLEAKEGKY